MAMQRDMDSSDNRSDALVMAFSGEHDFTSRSQLRAALAPLCEVPTVVLDFSNVSYVDSSVIDELARLHKARSARGLDRLTLVINNKGPIRKLFDVLDFKQIFRVVENLDDALGKNERIVVQYAPSPIP